MYTGVTTFKNLLGMTVLVSALATLWCAIRSWYELQGMRRWQHLGAEAIILAMAVYLLLTADSMTSFSCLMLAGTVMIVASRSFVMNRPWILHLTVAAAISVAVVALFFDNSGGMVKELGRNSSLTGRTAIWSEVIVLSRQFPWFGAGFESFWMGDRLLIMWRVVKGIQEAHDGYLEVYANLGWVGIALLGTLIVVGYRNVMDAWRRNVTIGTRENWVFCNGPDLQSHRSRIPHDVAGMAWLSARRDHHSSPPFEAEAGASSLQSCKPGTGAVSLPGRDL
jgi:exopolysaccharide production protein ExoQ